MRRDVVVAVRLTEAEAALVDRERGSLTRSAWLRLLLVRKEREAKPLYDGKVTINEDIRAEDF